MAHECWIWGKKLMGNQLRTLYVNTLYIGARNNMDAFWSSATVYQYMVKMLNAHRMLVYTCIRLWGFFSGSFSPDEIDFTFTLEFNSIANTELFNLDIY